MKQVKGFPDYWVSKHGCVYSIKKNHHKGIKQLKPYIDAGGRHRVNLRKPGQRLQKFVHHLVLEAFIGPCPEGMECCHNNDDKNNNSLENLRWDTHHNNMVDRIKHGLQNTAKLTANSIKLIYDAYWDGAYTQQELADMFSVDKSTIGRVTRKQSWTHIDRVTGLCT